MLCGACSICRMASLVNFNRNKEKPFYFLLFLFVAYQHVPTILSGYAAQNFSFFFFFFLLPLQFCYQAIASASLQSSGEALGMVGSG